LLWKEQQMPVPTLFDDVRDFMTEGPPALRDRTDPSYQRPLQVAVERRLSWQRLSALVRSGTRKRAE
jgi:hypothetical protein